MDDLEWPWTIKMVEPKWLKINQENLRMKFAIECSSPSSDHLRSRRPVHAGVKEGHPLKVVIFPLLACLAWKRFQIGTDMLLIKTSTSGVLFSGTNMDHLKWPWTPKISFWWFVSISGCRKMNCDQVDRDKPRLHANRNCCRLSLVSWTLAQISCCT